MRQVLFALILVATTAAVTSVVTSSICRRDDASEGVYSELVRASTPEEMAAAFEGLQKYEKYIGTVPKDVSRRAFQLTLEYRDIAFMPESDDVRFEYWTSYVSHLAAISGDVELFRKMSSTYFGSALGEMKGAWVEEFLQYNPELYFSLPDTWELWKHAGGAAWCCDDAKVTIAIVSKFASSTADGRKISNDILDSANDEFDKAPWAEIAKKLLIRY